MAKSCKNVKKIVNRKLRAFLQLTTPPYLRKIQATLPISSTVVHLHVWILVFVHMCSDANWEYRENIFCLKRAPKTGRQSSVVLWIFNELVACVLSVNTTTFQIWIMSRFYNVFFLVRYYLFTYNTLLKSKPMYVIQDCQSLFLYFSLRQSSHKVAFFVLLSSFLRVNKPMSRVVNILKHFMATIEIYFISASYCSFLEIKNLVKDIFYLRIG